MPSLDDATASDVLSTVLGMEPAMYSLVRQRLPGITVVGVGHRSTLDTNELRLIGGGRWEAKALAG